MEKKWTIKSSIICILLVLSLVVFASCKKKVNTEQSAGQDTQQEVVEDTTAADDSAAVGDDDAASVASEDIDENNDAAEMAELKDAFENVTIKFAYDSSAIMDSEIQTLEEKAEWLRNNVAATVTVEGHCDERGTTEYNLALGDRRAARVKGFLVNLGIGAERITTVSYGEEKPAVAGSNETAWEQNRRAEFKID